MKDDSHKFRESSDLLKSGSNTLRLHTPIKASTEFTKLDKSSVFCNDGKIINKK